MKLHDTLLTLQRLDGSGSAIYPQSDTRCEVAPGDGSAYQVWLMAPGQPRAWIGVERQNRVTVTLYPDGCIQTTRPLRRRGLPWRADDHHSAAVCEWLCRLAVGQDAPVPPSLAAFRGES